MSNKNSLQAWQTLFKERTCWAAEVTDTSAKLMEGIRNLSMETGVVRRSAAIAVENIKQHVGNLQPKFDDSKRWADDILKDQKSLLERWQPRLQELSKIPAFKELGGCLQGIQFQPPQNKPDNGPAPATTLLDFVNPAALKEASDVGAKVSKEFRASVTNLHTTFLGVLHNSHEVVENFSQGASLSDSDVGEQANRLMEEIEVLGKKVNADYEYINGLPNSQKTISQVSRTALLHTRNFLPSMLQIHTEMAQLWHDSAQRKAQTMESAVQNLQKISTLESTVAQIHARLAKLDTEVEDAEPFDLLNSLIRLPSVYGVLLVECVRRREWNEKMTMDSSSLVEELATFKEEELRRRRRWLKDMGGTVDLASIDDMALGVDVNIQAQKQSWPNIGREDITSFLRSLKEAGALDDVHDEVEERAKALDLPTKQQAKRAKAFKNGSIHDTGFGKNSLLLRGDDDLLHSMKNEKSKLEDRLKSSESRVRKLEDLLHRQSQMPRPPAGNPFGVNAGPHFERHITAPLPQYTSSLARPHEIPSRRSSIASRQNIMTPETEGSNLAQRIVALEAELSAEKAQSAMLRKSAMDQGNVEDELRSRVQEALSTKEDLMKNLEAQQREFDGERRLLEEENRKVKVKVEELEDELDRMLEKHEEEDKVRTLQGEVLALREDAARESAKAQEQIESLRNDQDLRLKMVDKLEKHVEEQRIENAELDKKYRELASTLNNRDQAQSEHHRGLRAALLQLSKDEAAPEDFNSLVDLVEVAAEKFASNVNQVRETLAATQAENLALEERAKERADEIYELTERLGTEEIEVFSARENLAEQKTRCGALAAELDLERKQHSDLRTKVLTAETATEALETRLQVQQREIDDLSTELIGCRTRIQALEGELQDRQTRLDGLQQVHDSLRNHFDAHLPRVDDISMRLHSQNRALIQLLETIGLTVKVEDNHMLIQKAPRNTGGSTMLSDASMSMHRSSSLPIATRSSLETPADDSVARWATSGKPENEAARFTKYVEEIQSFDLNAFNEAVIKRVKEIEHTARKWHKETRAYREKFHRAQSEAHDKIAFRSFKEGDLALFLPTRDQVTRPWAAFNVGAPHFFLREQDSHKLRSRDWLLARISKVEERVVNLAKSLEVGNAVNDRKSIGYESDGGASFDDENPFELSDGLRWYLLDAAEEKPGAPINIGLSKVTVASAHVDARGSIRMKKTLDGSGATKTLTRSLDGRRDSANSRKSAAAVSNNHITGAAGVEGVAEMSPFNPEGQHPPTPGEVNSVNAGGEAIDEVRKDLLWGP